MSAGHILVVDDEPSMRRYLQTVLGTRLLPGKRRRQRRRGAGEGATEAPDLVLLDLVLPGWDGLETLKRIRKASPLSKVVMISCVRDTRKVAQAMRLGAQDYLSKPIQKEEMDEVLRFCLQHSAPGSPESRKSRRPRRRSVVLLRHAADAKPALAGHAGGAVRLSRCCCWARAEPAKKCWRI